AAEEEPILRKPSFRTRPRPGNAPRRDRSLWRPRLYRRAADARDRTPHGAWSRARPGSRHDAGSGCDHDVRGRLVGLAGAVVVGTRAQSILFQMTSADPAVLALSAIALTLVALRAGFIAAHGASRVDQCHSPAPDSTGAS